MLSELSRKVPLPIEFDRWDKPIVVNTPLKTVVFEKYTII